MNEKFLFFNKVIVFGDKGSGKTTLIEYFRVGYFREVDSTENYKFL